MFNARISLVDEKNACELSNSRNSLGMTVGKSNGKLCNFR